MSMPIGLPQESVEVDGSTYLISAMPATDALEFMEKHLTNVNDGKIDLSTIKKTVCKYVSKDNMAISNSSFDIIFARKIPHLQRLFEKVLSFNFDDAFPQADTEE
jgi:hypothetical protein